MLLGPPVADNRALDRGRRVSGDWQAGLGGGQERDAARFAELQRAARVAGVEDVLDRDAVGAVLGEERRQAGVNGFELFGKRGAGRARQRTADDESVTAADTLDAAEPRAHGARIDPEDSHANEASISFSSMSAFDQTFLVSSCSSRMSISLTICCAGLPSSLT